MSVLHPLNPACWGAWLGSLMDTSLWEMGSQLCSPCSLISGAGFSGVTAGFCFGQLSLLREVEGCVAPISLVSLVLLDPQRLHTLSFLPGDFGLKRLHGWAGLRAMVQAHVRGRIRAHL